MKKGDLEKEKYYFLKSKHGQVPVVTVCVIKSTKNDYARGVSILSLRDKIDIKEGKRHARAAAMKALGTKTTNEVVTRLDAFDVLDIVDHEFLKIDKKVYKSFYNPILSKKEKELLGYDLYHENMLGYFRKIKI